MLTEIQPFRFAGRIKKPAARPTKEKGVPEILQPTAANTEPLGEWRESDVLRH